MAGYLWIFGKNQYGELGDDTTVDRSSPVQTVAGGADWSYVGHSNGYHRGAVKKDGTLWCWGRNDFFQLGDESSTNRSSPVQTAAYGNTWQSVDCGFWHTAGIKTDGTLWLWGRNISGQIGNDSTTDISSPVQTITYTTDWSSVACGFGHTAAIKTDGTLWLWGGNNWGGLGDNTTVYKSSPTQTVTGGTDWSKVACGLDFTAAVKTDGTLWTWGYNYFGQLGDDSTVSKSSPVQTIAGGTDWSYVACGYSSTGATKKDGTLWLWGENFVGNLGDNTSVNCSSPIQTITNGTNWDSISAGQYHALATKQDGVLWSWGFNSNGQLGNNQQFSKSSPVQTILGAKYWISVAAGSKSSAVISSVITLQLTTPIAQAYSGAVFGTQPVISFLDESSNVDTTVSLPVTASVTSGNATLSGTTTVNASSGVATFTNLKLTGFGQVTLTFASSAGITSVSQTLVLEIPAAVMPKRSETASSVPTSGQLRIGELAINITDQKGYVKKSDGTIVNVFTGLASGVITSGFVGNAAILSGNIGSGQIGFYHLASGAAGSTLSSGIVTSGYLGDNAVVSGSIGSGQIGIIHLASGTLSTVTLGSGQVTSGNIASGSVSQFKLSSGAVNSGHINDNAVVTSSIASGQVTGSKIAALTIANANLVNSTITIAGSSTALGASWAAAALNTASGLLAGTYYPSGSLTIGIASGGILAQMMASGSVLSGSIASGQIGQFHLASGAVTSGAIASGQIGQNHLASGVGGGAGTTVTDDIATNATRYVGFTSLTSGSLTTLNTASTKLTFNPSTGDFTAGGNITANSDEKIKTNIETISGALQKVTQMRGVYFNRIGTNIRNVGVIAQEVERVLPELVRESDGMKSVAYGNIVALLIEAIKEQNIRIEELEKRIL